MKSTFLTTTAVGLFISAAALAQSPSSATPPLSPAPAASSTTQTPAPTQTPSQSHSQSSTSAGSSGSAGNSTAAPAAANNPSSGINAQTRPTGSGSQNNNAAVPAPANSATNTSTPSNEAASQNGSSNPTTSNTSSAQKNVNAPAGNTTNVNASVSLNTQQQTRISETISRTKVQPLTNVNFSVSVGTVIPRNVSLHTVPADVVDVVPQYRGYSYVVVKDEIVIVDPATYKIVTVLPRSNSSTAATKPAKRKTFTDRDRDAVRKYSKTTSERRTVGSSSSVQVRKGERLPATVEIEEFPETVYLEAPALKEYRYIRRDSRTYVVDPAERVVIEEID